MILTFRPIKVRPEHWRDAGVGRPASPFGATYSDTLQLLDRELDKLGATDVHLQVEATDRDVRLDGQLRSDAKVNHPGVILTIETRKHGTLVYETDHFGKRWGFDAQPAWKENLRAIALGLEALRKVERYGIARRGEQYAGYRELPAGMPLDAGLTADEAVSMLASEAGLRVEEVLADVDAAFRIVAKVHHPDVGGDPDLFRELSEARDLLKAAS